MEERITNKKGAESENIKEETVSNKICLDPEAIRKLKTVIRKSKEMKELYGQHTIMQLRRNKIDS